MNKIRFIGESDESVKFNKIYKLLKFEDNTHQFKMGYFEIWIIDDNNKIRYIPYITMGVFNENWEVVNE